VIDALKMLEVSTREHQMTVLRDDGLYRHIRFAKPGTGIWRFDLVTWPGHLVITGDLEDFHFARVPDMFEFFRGPVGEVNAYYWAEKLRGPVRSKVYSPQRAKQLVFEEFWDRRANFAGQSAQLWGAIRDQILSWDVLPSEDCVRAALRDFRYVAANPIEPAGPARDFVPQRIPKRWNGTFEFTDSWEWDLGEWDFHFLVSLHAIVWGIHRYDSARAAAA
jgi:hypothetical protein